MIQVIVLAVILACGGMLAGGVAGEADYKHKVETGQVSVHTETETKIVVDESPAQ